MGGFEGNCGHMAAEGVLPCWRLGVVTSGMGAFFSS
jgi:hypothetical protein